MKFRGSKQTDAKAYEAPAIAEVGRVQPSITHICSYASSHTKQSTMNERTGTESVGTQTSTTLIRGDKAGRLE